MESKADMAVEIASGVWRVRADNPGPMIGTGTNSYVVIAAEGAVVIDPGPALPAHQAALLARLGGTDLRGILLTHPHLDHSGGMAALQAATGAKSYGFGDASAGRSAVMQALAAQGLAGGGEGVDPGFAPDIRLGDGEIVDLGGFHIEAIHTPGHMGAHLCFALGPDLFSGDHVMGWASTLISPPDGDMAGYMASLARLSAREWRQFWPGHGEIIADPAARLAELTAHRQARAAAILAALAEAPATPAALATRLYTDTPPALLPAAARNILAHLIDLHDRNIVTCADLPGPQAIFKIIAA